MSTPIPDYLWLRDYEQRLEFLATTQRDRTMAAFTSLFLSIR